MDFLGVLITIAFPDSAESVAVLRDESGLATARHRRELNDWFA